MHIRGFFRHIERNFPPPCTISSWPPPPTISCAVHRRLLALHTLECIGLTIALGCLPALLLVPILLWQRQPALTPILLVLSLSALAGTLRGWLTRPTLLAAALEADRQLKLSDLLGTALALRSSTSPDPWRSTIMALADSRCRTLSPSMLILHRLGVRAWGGVGLLVLLVLTLAGIPSLPVCSANVTGTPTFLSPRESAIARNLDLQPPTFSSNTTVARILPDHPRGVSSDSQPSDTTAAASASSGASSTSSSAADPSGGGLGFGRTSAAPTPQKRPSAAAPASPPSTTGGNIAGGTNGVATNAAAGNNGSASAGSSSRNANAPPWSTDHWPADRAAALDAIHHGAIPDAYRDLVRSYFSPAD